MPKLLFLLLVLSVALSACQHGPAVQINSLNDLNGEYLVSGIEPRAYDDPAADAMMKPAEAVRQAYDLTPLLIQNGNTIVHTHEGMMQSLDTFGVSLEKDTAVYLKATRDGRIQRFRLVYRMNDTLDWELVIPRKVLRGRDASVYMRLIKLHPAISFFSSDAVRWMRRPAQPETDAELSARIQNLLRYDAQYARTIYYSNVGYIDMVRFRLPFLYYNGGVEFTDTCKGGHCFNQIFYDSLNAVSAQRILKDAMLATEYPSRHFYVLEYADFFKAMAEYLERQEKPH